MSEVIFISRPLIERSFFQKFFGQVPNENSIIELNNLLATREIRDISPDEISEIENRYHINLLKKFSLNLEEFYATYYNYCLRDQKLDEDELEKLEHLKQILRLEDSVVNKLQNRIGETIYKNSYLEAIGGRESSDEKDAALGSLQKELKLPDEIVNKISSESRTKFINDKFQQMMADGRISPDEWNDFNLTAKNLKIDFTIDSKAQQLVEKYKLNWQFEFGELPVCQVDINLQKGEECYYKNSADWMEHRKVTTRVNYGGPVVRVRIMKGLSYRAGSMGVNRITQDQLQVIDSGIIYLTNKRVIFMGTQKNSNIKLDKILAIVPYSDGVEIEKDAGKSPILRVPNGADILAMTLSRLVKDAH